MHADREYMSRSIHAHTHTVYASQILYMGAEERVGEATASHTHTDTPHALLKGEGCDGDIFYHALCRSFSLSGGKGKDEKNCRK